MTKSKSGGSQTVDRALQILECFTLERPSLTLTELSELTGLTVPTTHRLLKALECRNFLLIDERTKRYSLGSGAMRLAGVIMQRDDLQAVVLPHLERLRAISEETTALYWYVDGARVCVLELVSRHFIRMSSGTGRRYPLYAGASGKAILAFLPNSTINDILDKAEREGVGPLINRSREAMMSELREIRSRGYATSYAEVVAHAAAVAAPIIDASGHPIAAINVTGPERRFDDQHIQALTGTLVDTVKTVETQMGYIRPEPTADIP